MTIEESSPSLSNKKLNLPPRVPGVAHFGKCTRFSLTVRWNFSWNPSQIRTDLSHHRGKPKVCGDGGLEANRFFSQDKDDLFSSEPLFGEFAGQMGSRNFMVALDGEPHRHMRKVMQRGYSKSGLAPHLDPSRGRAHLSHCSEMEARADSLCARYVSETCHRATWHRIDETFIQ